jgi:hypothetical protein
MQQSRDFFKNSSVGGGGGGGEDIYKKGSYYTESGEMTDRCWWQKVWYGVVCNSIGGGGGLGEFSPRKMLYFSTPRTALRAFSETDFWIYSVTLYFW